VTAVDNNGKKIWANEKAESGHGGSSQLIVQKVRATKIRNNTIESNPLIIAKTQETKRKNGTLQRDTWTDESTRKSIESRLRSCGTVNMNSVESIKKAMSTRLKNGTLLTCDEMKVKIRETKSKNNSFNANTPSSIALRAVTKNKTFIKRHSAIISEVIELYNNGLSKYEISKKLSASYDVVCTILLKREKGLL
jgi:hypothetical protein